MCKGALSSVMVMLRFWLGLGWCQRQHFFVQL
jgi:hypothetical protein